MRNSVKLIAVVIVVTMAIVGSPVVLIWATNTLFGLSIETNLTTWFAGLMLIGLFGR